MLNKLKNLAKKKSVLGLLAAVAVTGTIYETQFNKTPEVTKYVLGQVTRGTIVQSVSGTGQVSGQNQIDVTPSVSGAITKVFVQPGQTVKAGDPLFQIDNKNAQRTVRDALQSVRDAQLSLQSAKLSYEKSMAPATELELTKARNTVSQAEADLKNQEENVAVSSDGKTPKVIRTAYDSAATQLKSLAEDLRESLYDADSVLGMDNVSANDNFESLLSVLDSSRVQLAKASYAASKQDIIDLKVLTDTLSPAGADTDKIDATIAAADSALREAEPMLQQTYETLLATLTSTSFSQSQLDSLRGKIQSDHSDIASKLSSMNSLRNSLDQAKTSYSSSLRSLDAAKQRLEEARQSLADMEKGPDQVDISIQQNSISQRQSSLVSAQNRLNDARDALNDYLIKAPFDGIVVSVDGKIANQVTASTKLATLLTQSKMATIPLNEVDIAKIKVGQKATVTFDAVSDLTIAGQVTQVDPIGTVSQGVVTYNVQVSFLSDDDRIKPSMSASVSVATDVRTDVLTVPNGAIKNKIVQILPNEKNPSSEAQSTGVASATPPESITVETGLANDQYTEIVSGVNEGDWIVTRTISPTAASTSATKTNNSSLIPGASGGNVRIQRF